MGQTPKQKLGNKPSPPQVEENVEKAINIPLS